MKYLLRLFFILFFIESIYGQSSVFKKGEWLDNKNNYKFTKGNFNQPPSFYAPYIFWFWNDTINPGYSAHMAKEMTSKNINPGYIKYSINVIYNNK